MSTVCGEVTEGCPQCERRECPYPHLLTQLIPILTDMGNMCTTPDTSDEDQQCWDQTNGCSAESLLALGRVGHVSNNTPISRQFEGLIRKFVQELLHTYWTCETPSENTGTSWPPHWYRGFSVRPIGSFPCDTKVGEMDEFDYLCMLEVDQRWWIFQPDGDDQWLAKVIVPGKLCWDLYPHYRHLLNPLTLHSTGTVRQHHPNLPHITDIYYHGPATCVQLAWTCDQGHGHDVSIDVSLAAMVSCIEPEGDAELVDQMIKSRIDGLPAPFQGLRDCQREYIFVCPDPHDTSTYLEPLLL